MKNPELRLSCVGPFLLILLHTGNTDCQHPEADKKEHKSSSKTFSSVSRFDKGSLHQAHCFHTAGVPCYSWSHRAGRDHRPPLIPASCPQEGSAVAVLVPTGGSQTSSKEGSTKKESMTHSNYIFQRFTIITFGKTFLIFCSNLPHSSPKVGLNCIKSLVLMSKQFLSPLPTWKLLYYTMCPQPSLPQAK